MLFRSNNNATGDYYKVTLCKDNKQFTKRIHKLVAHEFVENPENKSNIDHIDRNRSNNQYNNLRWVSSSENSRNRIKQSNTSSKYKGVCFDKHHNNWKCSINNKHVGYYETEKDAARAYNAQALLIDQEHYNINEISDSDDESDNVSD